MCPDSNEQKSALNQANRARMLGAARRGSLIPFIGAGFSSQTTPENKPTKGDQATPQRRLFPTWRMLAEEMLVIAQAEDYIDEQEAAEMLRFIYTEDFPLVAEKLRFRLPSKRYLDILIEKLNPPSVSPTSVHEALFNLNAPIILTSNYDLLLEDAYARKEDKAANVYTYRDTDLALKTIEENRLMMLQENKRYDVRPIVFKIYGSISSPSDMILTERDFTKKIIRQVDLPDLLSKIFITSTLLILGFSTFDVELNILLDNLGPALRYEATPDYMIISRETILRDIKAAAPNQVIEDAEMSIQEEISKFRKYRLNLILFNKDEDVFKLVGELSDELEKPSSN